MALTWGADASPGRTRWAARGARNWGRRGWPPNSTEVLPCRCSGGSRLQSKLETLIDSRFFRFSRRGSGVFGRTWGVSGWWQLKRYRIGYAAYTYIKSESFIYIYIKFILKWYRMFLYFFPLTPESQSALLVREGPVWAHRASTMHELSRARRGYGRAWESAVLLESSMVATQSL
jgi:hypothetical protein